MRLWCELGVKGLSLGTSVLCSEGSIYIIYLLCIHSQLPRTRTSMCFWSPNVALVRERLKKDLPTALKLHTNYLARGGCSDLLSKFTRQAISYCMNWPHRHRHSTDYIQTAKQCVPGHALKFSSMRLTHFDNEENPGPVLLG